jgi:hypothetical protein
MEFTRKKLPKDALGQLCQLSIHTVQPYALMLAPIYVLLKENEKFVSVKAPLDFFVPDELTRLSPYENFYLPDLVISILPYREAGARVKAILSWKRAPKDKRDGSFLASVQLPPPPFEVSDAVLKILGPLWWDQGEQGAGVEPYFITIFVNELCELLPSEKLLYAREKDSENFEQALLKSSWVVFLALHLGYYNLDFLNELRLRVFQEVVDEKLPSLVTRNEVEELINIVHLYFRSSTLRLFKGDFFSSRIEKVSRKLASRLERIKAEMLSRNSSPPSIYGEKGFIDV